MSDLKPYGMSAFNHQTEYILGYGHKDCGPFLLDLKENLQKPNI